MISGSKNVNDDWLPFLRLTVIWGASGAILVALIGLLGYLPGMRLLASVSENFIPMAPSTAISFIILGGILLAMNFWSFPRLSLFVVKVMAALTSLFGALEVIGYFLGKDLNFEDALVPDAGYLGSIPIARMSPATGAVFFLVGMAVFALVLRQSKPHARGAGLGHFGGILSGLTLIIGLLFSATYLYDSPLFYGQGSMIPMALTTALAFFMLGIAAVSASGENSIPLSLLIGSLRRIGKSMHWAISARKRFILLALIMIGACAMVMAVITVILYRHDIQVNREMLTVTAKSQARLIEAVARYDAKMAIMKRSTYPNQDAMGATLSQVFEANKYYEGFGKTGELMLARRSADSIIFVVRHQDGVFKRPEVVPFDSNLAKPMQRALKGLSGTMFGLDYRGEMVLAAYEPVRQLNLGIVTKINQDEIRAPFIRSSFVAGAIAFFVVLAGSALFFWIGNPIIARLEKHSKNLGKEVEERKRTEVELKKANNYIFNIINSMPSTLVGVDLDGRVTQWNKTAEDATGITADDAQGKKLSDVFPHMALDMEKINESISSREIKREFKKPYKTEGGVKYEDVTVFPLVTNGVEGAVVRIDDVTKKCEIEEQLNQSRKMDAIGQLAGGVAHDFNNMLEGIMIAAQLLKSPKRNLDKEGLEYVKMIFKAVMRAADLTTKLLAFGRKGKIASTAVDIHSIMDEAVTILERTLDKKISISTEKQAKNHTIVGYNTGLQSAFMNLGINASHAMPDGGKLQIETKNISLSGSYCNASPFEIEPGEYVEIEIRDTGCGIPAEKLPKIFEPFFTTKKQGEGTGLGLAAVYGTVQAHHGAVNVYSEVGIGTVFHIYLPCSGELVEPRTIINEEILIGSGLILLVDDEEIIRITGKLMIEEMGYEVMLAKNGREAVDVFQKRHADIDLVIMDMIMPEMNGSEAFMKMKEIDPDCKVVIQSGFSKEEGLSELRKLGLAGFIQKPYRDYELSQLLAKILTK